MKKSLLALASGTLGLGIAEFVMMGILPNVAHDLNISIPEAGHFISAVCHRSLCGSTLDGVCGSYASVKADIIRARRHLCDR